VCWVKKIPPLFLPKVPHHAHTFSSFSGIILLSLDLVNLFKLLGFAMVDPNNWLSFFFFVVDPTGSICEIPCPPPKSSPRKGFLTSRFLPVMVAIILSDSKDLCFPFLVTDLLNLRMKFGFVFQPSPWGGGLLHTHPPDTKTVPLFFPRGAYTPQ